jgi:hypothetical protein
MTLKGHENGLLPGRTMVGYPDRPLSRPRPIWCPARAILGQVLDPKTGVGKGVKSATPR